MIENAFLDVLITVGFWSLAVLGMLASIVIVIDLVVLRKRRPKAASERVDGELDLLEGKIEQVEGRLVEKLNEAVQNNLPKGCRQDHAPVRYTSDDCPACELNEVMAFLSEVQQTCEKALERGASKRKLRGALRSILSEM